MRSTKLFLASSQGSTLTDGARPTEFRALWLGDPHASDVGRMKMAVDLFVAASKVACARWPKIYGPVADLEILCRGSSAPPNVAEAARSAGCRIAALAAEADFLAAQCDLAIVSAAELPRAGFLPAIVLPFEPGAAPLFDLGGPSLVSGGLRGPDVAARATAENVAAAFAPPRPPQEARMLVDYLVEDASQRVGRYAYNVLLAGVGQSFLPDAGEPNAWNEAMNVGDRARPGAVGALKGLHAEYVRADALAVAYGRRWRSTVVARSLLLLVTSVCTGLIGSLFPAATIVTIPIQVIATLLIFWDRRHARQRHWRERWIEYRRLTEMLRAGRLLVLCGVARRLSGQNDWINWERNRVTCGSPSFDPLDDHAAPTVINHLMTIEINEQIAYQRAAFRRFRRLDQAFRRAANFALFILVGLAAVLLALRFTPFKTSESLKATLGLALIGAPSLYAAINNVRRELDVERQAQRSAKVAAGLKRLARLIAASPPTAAVAQAAALRAVEIMNEAVFSWSNVVGIL
jgi:hypothetical protein